MKGKAKIQILLELHNSQFFKVKYSIKIIPIVSHKTSTQISINSYRNNKKNEKSFKKCHSNVN